MKITGNTILITGGTSGIGRGLAEAFHERGNRVIVAGRRQADEITERHPGVVGLQADLNDVDALANLTSEVRDRFPELNVLIANAGISQAEDMMSESWDARAGQAMVETNILGVLRVTAALLLS